MAAANVSGDLVDLTAWLTAGFYGIALGTDSTGENPPFLGCLFKDEAAARKIFQALNTRLGRMDERGELRISIVEGDIPGEKPGYTVHIGGGAGRPGKLHRVSPPAGSTNLAEFKEQLAKHGAFLLMPLCGKQGALTTAFEVGIEKKAAALALSTVAEVNAGGGGDPDAPVLRR